MYSGICLGNHPAVLLLLQDLFALRGTRRLTTNTRRWWLSANRTAPRDEWERKVGKYYNEPSCISAGTQLVTTLNERCRKVATQLVETSLMDVSHYGREEKVLVRKSKPGNWTCRPPSGSLSCLYLRLPVPLRQGGQGSLVAFPGRHTRDGANHRFITAPQSDSQDLSLQSLILLPQHAGARMLNFSLQHRRGLPARLGFFFFFFKEPDLWMKPAVRRKHHWSDCRSARRVRGMWWAAAPVHREHSEAVTNEAFRGEKLGVVDLQMSRSCNFGCVFTYNYQPPLAIWQVAAAPCGEEWEVWCGTKSHPHPTGLWFVCRPMFLSRWWAHCAFYQVHCVMSVSVLCL